MTRGLLVLREVAAYKRNAGDHALADRLDAVADQLAASFHHLAIQMAVILGDIDDDGYDWAEHGWGEEGGVVPPHPARGGGDG